MQICKIASFSKSPSTILRTQISPCALTVFELPPEGDAGAPEEQEQGPGGDEAADDLAVAHALLAGVEHPAILAPERHLLNASDERICNLFYSTTYNTYCIVLYYSLWRP